jgi:hypothetical protein
LLSQWGRYPFLEQAEPMHAGLEHADNRERPKGRRDCAYRDAKLDGARTIQLLQAPHPMLRVAVLADGAGDADFIAAHPEEDRISNRSGRA